jgi:predicted nucleotide-binding protein (sugar kinase/HSP70/actin superfamily)
MVKVGIPRALLYYQYYPMWKTFFEGLGAEVVVSPPTTQATLSSGSSRVVADTCLPVKVFCGHVLALVEKCDYIFIPALRSVKSKIYNCSKFLGLPDMTRAVIPECPPILDIDIDINKGKRRLYQAIYKLGRHFSWDPLKIRRAALAAWQAHQEYKELMVNEGLTPPQAIARISGAETPSPRTDKPAIALVGHPYLLYDELINHRLIHRLEQAGYRTPTPEMLTTEQLGTGVTKLTGRPYWTYEEEVVGSGGHYLESGVDGVIGVVAFGCGPDSLMMDMVQRRAIKLKTTPFMSLTLEEHSAEAGVITRLEAFLDMIQRRKRREAEVCT